MGFAFLPIGIGSLIAGSFGGKLIHHFGEVTHQPEKMCWAVIAVGVLTALLLVDLRSDADAERDGGEGLKTVSLTHIKTLIGLVFPESLNSYSLL